MKVIMFICFIVALAVVGWVLPGTVAVIPHYGPPFGVATETPLAEVVSGHEALGSQAIKVAGEIVRQCPSAGCWFYIKDGQGNQVKVELGHMGMKFPQSIGKTAVVEGRVLASAKSIEVVGDRVEFR